MARDLTKRRPAPLPALGPKETARYWWNQLTSMRTALALLFLLAVAAIPGSIVPQTSINPIKVEQFIQNNPELGEFYAKIGMFNVFTSPWFSAIYLLLFCSLIGCIIPRVVTYAKAVRAEPVRTPARLTRMKTHAVARSEDGAEEVLERARGWLRKRRYRVVVRDGAISAERGFLREAGNLVFHLSLIMVLIGVATGALYGYRGGAIVVVGQGFANVATQYDDLSSGPEFTTSNLPPFQMSVDSFDAQFEMGPVQTGAARVFRAEVTVIDRPGAQPRHERLEVNHPVKVGSTQVHLLGHGYAPVVTVRDAQGNVAWSGPVVFLPQDGNFTSVGVIKAFDARPEMLAFQGQFVPTGDIENLGPVSQFPALVRPQLALNGYHGPPREETGVPENVYSLNTDGLTQFTDGDDLWRTSLRPGETAELPDGQGSISFDGVERWVQLQISSTPGLGVTGVAISLAVIGLCFSLFIRPRRLWVRAIEDGDGVRIEVAGLDRADARVGLDEDVTALTEAAEGRLGSPDGPERPSPQDPEYRDPEPNDD